MPISGIRSERRTSSAGGVRRRGSGPRARARGPLPPRSRLARARDAARRGARGHRARALPCRGAAGRRRRPRARGPHPRRRGAFRSSRLRYVARATWALSIAVGLVTVTLVGAKFSQSSPRSAPSGARETTGRQTPPPRKLVTARRGRDGALQSHDTRGRVAPSAAGPVTKSSSRAPGPATGQGRR